MCENLQFSGDLVPFTKEIPNKTFSPKFLRAVDSLSAFQGYSSNSNSPAKGGCHPHPKVITRLSID